MGNHSDEATAALRRRLAEWTDLKETALSPLQYQKQLRLQEARRLILTERVDAAYAAFKVGYESPSQFSREYNPLFGAPPWRDITKLRQISVTE